MGLNTNMKCIIKSQLEKVKKKCKVDRFGGDCLGVTERDGAFSN